jgi:NADH-quinone oxidoreductase subunit G
MPKVEIDGRSIEVEDGVTVIQAADRLGIEIPHYCWHPGLTIAGNCRMCLVEIEKAPKLQIACNIRVTDGMVVHTTSAKTKTAQKAVLEFLLINRPTACPVRAQAAARKLQRRCMDRDRQGRVPLSGRSTGKPFPRPNVMLDQELRAARAACASSTRTDARARVLRARRPQRPRAGPEGRLDNPYSTTSPTSRSAPTNRDFDSARASGTWAHRFALRRLRGGCNIDTYHREGGSSGTCRASTEVNQY